MLVAVGWWPPEIPFDTDDLTTVIKILNGKNDVPHSPTNGPKRALTG